MVNSMLLMPTWAILTIVLSVIVALFVAIIVMVPINVWFRALASGAYV